MNNDIKEIKRPGQILDYVDTKEHLVELFNYITNLQKQNKQLVKDILNQDKKIDKAIEYIKGTHFYSSRTIGKSLFSEYFNNLLNILKGENNDK